MWVCEKLMSECLNHLKTFYVVLLKKNFCVDKVSSPNLWLCPSGPPIQGRRSRTFRPKSFAALASVSCARREEILPAVCTWSRLNSICSRRKSNSQIISSVCIVWLFFNWTVTGQSELLNQIRHKSANNLNQVKMYVICIVNIGCHMWNSVLFRDFVPFFSNM